MKRGMKTFARAVRDGDCDKAEEMLDKIVQGNMKVNVWEGYHRALVGIVKALNSDNDLTFPQQIAEDKFSTEELEKVKEDMDARASQEFRPEDEQGFNAAWNDVLQVYIDDAQD